MFGANDLARMTWRERLEQETNVCGQSQKQLKRSARTHEMHANFGTKTQILKAI